MKIGDKLNLWKYNYSKEAYLDQFGIPHPAYVVLETIPVTITEVQKFPGEYSGEASPGDGYRAVSDDGRMFQQNWGHFPDASMSPYFYWIPEDISKYSAEGCPDYSEAIQAANWKIHPYVDNNGNKAVPPDSLYCSKHQCYYHVYEECFYCKYSIKDF